MHDTAFAFNLSGVTVCSKNMQGIAGDLAVQSIATVWGLLRARGVFTRTVCVLLLAVFYLAIPERFARTQQVKRVGKHHMLAKGNHVVKCTGKKVF